MSFSETSTSASFTLATRLSMSPIPRRRPMNLPGTNCSMSSIFSPVPMNLMGAPVAATPDRAPPPLAEPSSLETMMEPTSVASLNAAAWAAACWPMVPSKTRMISWGFTALAICCISTMRDFSSLWRPDVSRRTTS